MDRFLVQVSKDLGYANITENHRYENHHWMNKPRDHDHGEVKAGDELLVYCTGSVPDYGKKLAFRVLVKGVSPDHVEFGLGPPIFFSSPLSRHVVHAFVDQKRLPEEFRKCGQQGFNIVKIQSELAEEAFALIEGHGNGGTEEEDWQPKPKPDPEILYSIDDIISEGCFLERARLETILERLRGKKNHILQGLPGTGKTWLAKKLAYALIGNRSEPRVRPFQFHPNLSYEDFVRGWRPSGDGRLALLDGPFLQAIEDAAKEPSLDFVVIIEEINRGNPA